ncbi:MAG: MgtC/SapB family protein [Rhodothermales bacterium]|nr:MgtC/SapB family protein [Rhodothermales bacterium]
MELTQLDLFYRFGAAFVIGLLVGLQREYAKGHEVEEDLFAGARTFTLLSLAGAAGAYLALVAGTMSILVVTLAILGVMVTIAYLVASQAGELGQTTEVAAIVISIAGALCILGDVTLAVAIAVATTVLLSLKLQTESLAKSLTEEDVYASLKFAVITVIVLPILPRTGYGPEPFNALVPFNIWLMVVFISGISFLGYILIKIVGPRRGVGITGVLGGLVSSTAVTLSFSQRSRDTPSLAVSFALAILLAWSVMFARVMIETAAINMSLFRIVWLPLLAAMVVTFSYCAYLYIKSETSDTGKSESFTNPFKLKPALTFGVLYALIFLIAKSANLYFGNTGVLVSSIVAGLADVDAITLSMAELSRDGGIELDTAAKAVVLAAASNTIVKGAIVLGTGSKKLRRVILPGLLASLSAAIVIVFLI